MKETTLDNSIESKRRRRRALKKTIEKIMNAVFFVCGAAAIAAVALITVYMVVSGLPAIREIGLLDFLFGTEWKSTAAEPKFGILPFILTSIWGTLGAIVIGVPVGLLTAVFLSKVASRRVASVVRPAVELLAGIPSVVYGLIGMMVLVPGVRSRSSRPSSSSSRRCTLPAHQSSVRAAAASRRACTPASRSSSTSNPCGRHSAIHSCRQHVRSAPQSSAACRACPASDASRARSCFW